MASFALEQCLAYIGAAAPILVLFFLQESPTVLLVVLHLLRDPRISLVLGIVIVLLSSLSLEPVSTPYILVLNHIDPDSRPVTTLLR